MSVVDKVSVIREKLAGRGVAWEGCSNREVFLRMPFKGGGEQREDRGRSMRPVGGRPRLRSRRCRLSFIFRVLYSVQHREHGSAGRMSV